MEVKYSVHRVSAHPVVVKGVVDGEAMNVETNSIEIELVPVSGPHGTLTLRFIGKDAAQAQQEFKDGQDVSLVLSVALPSSSVSA